MKLVKVEKDSVRISVSRQRLLAIIDEFMSSDSDICEVVFTENEYINKKSCYTAYRSAIKRSGRLCEVFTRNGHVYLSKLTFMNK